MPLVQKAAFVWSMEKCSSADLAMLTQYVNRARTCGMEIAIWGPPCVQNKYPQYYRGLPTYENLLDCFDHSHDGYLYGNYDRAWIVIDDYSQDCVDNDPGFYFDDHSHDYYFDYSELKSYMDQYEADDICVVVRGKGSGRALVPLEGVNRIVMTGMAEDECTDNFFDDFNIAQHLDCSFNWRAAFEMELFRLANSTPPQTPQISP